MKKLLILSLVLVIVPVLLFSSISTALGAPDYDPDDPGQGIVPNCNQFLFPNEGGCNVGHAYQLARNIMKFLIYLKKIMFV